MILRMVRLGGAVVVATLLAGACSSERSLTNGPVPEAMVPDQTTEGVEVAVEIQGEAFLPDATISHRPGNAGTLDETFLALLAPDQALTGVLYQDPTRLLAAVPSTVPVGRYDLIVIDAEGRTGTLEDAFEVTAAPCTRASYTDADGDGFGDPGTEVIACPPPVGNIDDGSDCDDADPDNWVGCGTCVDGDLDGFFVGCDAYVIRQGPDCNDADTGSRLEEMPCDPGDACIRDAICLAGVCAGVNTCAGSCENSCDGGCAPSGCCVPPTDCSGGTCDTCVDACSCNYVCNGGSSCDARCEAGTTCRLGTDGTDTGTLTCVDAVCNLSCESGSLCELTCQGQSVCLLDCNSITTCRLICAAGGTSCGGGIEVCNRPCP